MTHFWLLNAIGLFVTTVGVLLILLHLTAPSWYANELHSPEAKRAFVADRRRLVIALALVSLWLIVQDIGILLL